MSEANPRDRADHALRQANRAAKAGDLKGAQHWNKLARELTETATRLASLPPPPDTDEESRRAELRRRIAMFVDASNACEQWERDHELYVANVAAAIANNVEPPPPMRPHPSGKLGENEYLDRIARGEVTNDPSPPRGGEGGSEGIG